MVVSESVGPKPAINAEMKIPSTAAYLLAAVSAPDESPQDCHESDWVGNEKAHRPQPTGALPDR